MQVNVDVLEGLTIRLTITVENSEVEQVVSAKLREIAKTRRFDGFRKGKVPMKMVENMYGESARDDALIDIMNRSYFQALSEENINPAGVPTFDSITNDLGEDFVFAANVETYPAIELANLDLITIEKPVATVTDDDVDDMLNTLRKQQATWVDTDKAADNDKRVIIDFIGSIDGEEFAGGKAENFPLEMGGGRMIPGFEDGIIGKTKGMEFDMNVTFPADYHSENLKGKAAVFKLKINQVQERQLPELNDELAAQFNVTKGGVEALKAEVRKNMERELKHAIKGRIKEQAIEGLVANNSILVPTALVEKEIEALRSQAAQRFGNNPDAAAQLPRELFSEQANRRVIVGLLLGEFITSNEIKLDESKVKELILDIASAYEDPSELITFYEKDQRMMDNMRNLAIEEQAIDMLVSYAQVVDKQLSFKELVGSNLTQ